MYNTDIQKSVLGSMILSYIEKNNYDIIEDILCQINSEYFDLKNKIIFEAINNLYEKQEPINNISITQECNGKIEAWYISELFLINNELVTSSSYQYYVNKLAENYIDRMIKNARTTDDIEKILENKNKKTKIETISFNDAIDQAIIESKSDSSDVINYGYKFIDERLGGIKKGELVLIGGITGTGKSTFSIKIGLNASKNNKRVVIVSLEERIVQRARKEIYYYCNRKRKIRGENTFRLVDYLNNKKKFTEFEEFEAKEFLKNNISYLKTDSRIMINDIKNIFKLKADLYIFDHLHYFGMESGDDSKANAVEKAMQEIKNLTVEYETRTILVAHFKKLDETKRPTMTDFKDSISIAQTADTILLLWRDKSKDSVSQYETEFICPKNRIDEPTFTSTAFFDVLTNDYLKEKNYSLGTENSDLYQKALKTFNPKEL